MSESIICALITGVLALAGVIISNISTAHKMESRLELNQAVMDTKLSELTREVREHNNFAKRMPVVENQIANIIERLDKIERG